MTQLLHGLAFQPDHADHVAIGPGPQQERTAQRFTQAQAANEAFRRAGLFAFDVGVIILPYSSMPVAPSHPCDMLLCVLITNCVIF